MLDVTVFSGDEGVPLDYTVVDDDGAAQDLSIATSKEYTIEKPDGTTSEVAASFVTDGSDGKLRYVLPAVDQVGVWRYRPTYVTPLGTYNGTWLEFYAGEPSPVKATWGGADANSYITVKDASAFITSSVIDSVAWKAADNVTRAAALLEATRDIDSYEYLGCRYYSDQMLLFPRELLGRWPWNRTNPGENLLSVEQNRMKVAVQHACCYQALFLLRNNGRDEHGERIAAGIHSIQQITGQAQEAITYTWRSGNSKLCLDALASLKPYRGQKSVYRG